MRKASDIVFVILNYNTFNETKVCVESIKKNIGNVEYGIVVIDNCSTDQSVFFLKKEYDNDCLVDVVLCEENVGFAKGNNIGIRVAREKYNSKFICCLNSDTIFEDQDFVKKMKESYEHYHPAIIGPKIILKDGQVQSIYKRLLTIDKYKAILEHYKNPDKISVIKIKEQLLMIPIVKKINQCRKKESVVETQLDVILHGCCIVFTDLFFEKLKGFDSRTFLYREEELLFLSLKKRGLHSLSLAEAYIRHLEDAATDTICKTAKEKRNFMYRYQIESLEILIDELMKNEVE